MIDREFYLNVVEPNITDFLNQRNDQRKLYNSCITLYHLIQDYQTIKTSSGLLKSLPKDKSFEDQFKAIRSVCNGVKHFEYKTANKLKEAKAIFHAGDEIVSPPAMAGVMQCGVSRLGDTQGSFILPNKYFKVEKTDGWIYLDEAIYNLKSEIDRRYEIN